MKKCICIFIFTVMSTQAYTQCLDYIKHGEYAIYHDTRGGLEFLRGYWLAHVEGGHYIVLSRNKNLDNNKEVNYLIEFEEGQDGKPSIVKTNGIVDGTPQEYTQGLVDFMNFTYLYLNNIDEIEFDSLIEDQWEQSTLQYYFNRLLPFFRISVIREKGVEVSQYSLNSSGIIEGTKLDEFLKREILFINEKTRKEENKYIPIANSKSVTINGFSTVLDDNWIRDDSLGIESYWLALYSERDSQVSVERLDEDMLVKKELSDEDICRLNIITTLGVDYKTVSSYYRNEQLHLTYTIYDNLGIKNYQMIMFKTRNDQKYIINFSSFADIFDANKDYFNKILETLNE